MASFIYKTTAVLVFGSCILLVYIFTFDDLTLQVSAYSTFAKKLEYAVPENSKQNNEIESRNQTWMRIKEELAHKPKRQRNADIIGIGVEKCGTHFLHHILQWHPSIRFPTGHLETHFFDERNNRPLSDYTKMMPMVPNGTFVWEKTPAYFSFPPLTMPGDISKTVPDAKLVLIICDPVKRAFSDFVHEWVLYNITKQVTGVHKYNTMDDYLQHYVYYLKNYIKPWNGLKDMSESNKLIHLHQRSYMSTILTTGLYALHLNRWLPHYNESNLMIINGDEMFDDPGTVFERLQEFAGLQKLIFRQDFVRDPETGYFCYKHWRDGLLKCLPSSKTRTRGGKRKMLPRSIELLRDFYRQPNEDLYKLLGKRFDWT